MRGNDGIEGEAGIAGEALVGAALDGLGLGPRDGVKLTSELRDAFEVRQAVFSFECADRVSERADPAMSSAMEPRPDLPGLWVPGDFESFMDYHLLSLVGLGGKPPLVRPRGGRPRRGRFKSVWAMRDIPQWARLSVERVVKRGPFFEFVVLVHKPRVKSWLLVACDSEGYEWSLRIEPKDQHEVRLERAVRRLVERIDAFWNDRPSQNARANGARAR